MNQEIQIGSHKIGKDHPVYVIAEMSANHLQDYDRAVRILHAAKEAGADCIKLQTYTADTITFNGTQKHFRITGGTIWDGTTLYRLYEEAYTPWEWQPRLMEEAKKLGLDCFSSPFDFTAVDFMEEMDMPAYKIASYEINDIPLIRKVARLGKPVILSTGIATFEDIELALDTCREAGNEQIALLKCVSSYPTPYEAINLRHIRTLADRYGCIMGLSDHTMGSTVAVASIAMGARIIEKHLTLRRADGGPDGSFSMEPEEFADMVQQIRIVEKALGTSEYFLNESQLIEHEGARSLFAVKDIAKGEVLTPENVRSIRPGNGLHTKYYDEILGKNAASDIKAGTPLSFDLISM